MKNCPTPMDCMDLRDYFAAKVIEGMCRKFYPHEIIENTYSKDIYQAAYIVADEMMKAREK